MGKKIKAMCLKCGNIYSINPTSKEDKDLRIRSMLIPTIYCNNCNCQKFKLYYVFE